MPCDSVNSPQLLRQTHFESCYMPVCLKDRFNQKRVFFYHLKCFHLESHSSFHPQFQSEPSGKDSQHNIYPISLTTVRTDARSSLSGFIIAVDEAHCRIVLFVSITGPDVEDLWFVIALSDGDASVTGITDDLGTWGLQSRSDD